MTHTAVMTFPAAIEGVINKTDPTVTMGDLSYTGKVPIYGFCRLALAAGLTGRLTIVLEDGSPSCSVDIEGGSKLTIAERDKGSLQLVPFRPFPVRA